MRLAAAPLTCFRLSTRTPARHWPALVGDRSPQIGCTEHTVTLNALFGVKAQALAGFWWSIRLASWAAGGGGGPTRSPVDDVRGGKGTNVASHSLHQLLLQLRAVFDVLHERHVSVDALALHWVLIPAWHKSRFGLHLAMTETRARKGWATGD